jgi:hypothetical protein
VISLADQKKLADAFVAGRDRTGTREVQDMIKVAARRIHADFEKIPVEVRFTSRDPYKSMAEMRDQVRSTGILYIWTGASNVPMWDPQTNWKARAVHDWQHISEQFDFTMDGEYEGFRAAARKAPRLAPLYFSEIAMQAAVANTHGDFPGAQKIVIPSPEQFRHLRGLEKAPVFSADQVAIMHSVMSEAEIAKLFGALGVDAPMTRIEAARIYDATVQGQMEKAQ